MAWLTFEPAYYSTTLMLHLPTHSPARVLIYTATTNGLNSLSAPRTTVTLAELSSLLAYESNP